MQIAIAIITLVLCAGVLYWFKRSENQKRTRRTEEEEDERERLAQKTAQEFVNAKDLGEHCLYTIDGLRMLYWMTARGRTAKRLLLQRQTEAPRQWNTPA